jgi:hypothetical protein
MTFTKMHPPKELATLTQEIVVTSTSLAIITDVTTKLTEGQVQVSRTTTVQRGNWLLSMAQSGKKLQIQIKAVVAFTQSKRLCDGHPFFFPN